MSEKKWIGQNREVSFIELNIEPGGAVDPGHSVSIEIIEQFKVVDPGRG